MGPEQDSSILQLQYFGVRTIFQTGAAYHAINVDTKRDLEGGRPRLNPASVDPDRYPLGNCPSGYDMYYIKIPMDSQGDCCRIVGIVSKPHIWDRNAGVVSLESQQIHPNQYGSREAVRCLEISTSILTKSHSLLHRR